MVTLNQSFCMLTAVLPRGDIVDQVVEVVGGEADVVLRALECRRRGDKDSKRDDSDDETHFPPLM